jgi:hypothetical protein
MTSDAEGKERPLPPTDRWALPEILTVTAMRVKYTEPKIRFLRTEAVKYWEAIEIVVDTSEELPARPIPPVLFVGDVLVGDYERFAPRRYRFFVFEPGMLEEGAKVGLGWPQAPARRRSSRFTLVVEAKGEEK